MQQASLTSGRAVCVAPKFFAIRMRENRLVSEALAQKVGGMYARPFRVNLVPQVEFVNIGREGLREVWWPSQSELLCSRWCKRHFEGCDCVAGRDWPKPGVGISFSMRARGWPSTGPGRSTTHACIERGGRLGRSRSVTASSRWDATSSC